jgi:SAM-dependent methyltransferase
MTGPLGPDYDARSAAALSSEVFPQYLSLFGAMALDRLVRADVRSGEWLAAGPLASMLTDRVLGLVSDVSLHLYEPSASLVARQAPPQVRAAALGSLPLPERDETFAHAVIVHPISNAKDRLRLLSEVQRTTRRGGSVVFAAPLRGSYPEIADMMREYALKHDRPKLGEAVELVGQGRPTPETLGNDLETIGFSDVEIDVSLVSIPFSDGRRFAESALFHTVIAPQFATSLDAPITDAPAALDYVRHAIAKYWSDGQFDLTVNLGCATARRA